MSHHIKNITLSTQRSNISGYELIDIVEKYKFLVSLFRNNVVEIKWNQIKKIGTDVILVDMNKK